MAGCAYERPIHPMRLEGFPGAAIDKDHFPLEPATWVFRDRLDPDRAPLRLTIRRKGKGLALSGVSAEAAEVAFRHGYLEIRYQDRVVGRPLKLRGVIGDHWQGAGDATCTAYGYDRIKVLGKTWRALVVASESQGQRDIYWFVPELGWVRIRTELSGRAVRDAVLTELTRP